MAGLNGQKLDENAERTAHTVLVRPICHRRSRTCTHRFRCSHRIEFRIRMFSPNATKNDLQLGALGAYGAMDGPIYSVAGRRAGPGCRGAGRVGV